MKARTHNKTAPAIIAFLLMLLSASLLHAQAASAATTRRTTDIAIMYTAEDANPVADSNFWLKGGSVELGVSLWHAFGVAGNFTGTHTSSAGSQNVPLGLMVYTFGPRYRWVLPTRYSPKGRPTSVFAEALVGGVKGFDSLFPTPTGATRTASSVAIQLGFGLDIKLKNHLDIRPAEVCWVRTQLPNTTTNVQNDLRLSTGIALRY